MLRASRHYMVSRRHFLRASAATAASGLGLGVYTWRVEPHWLEVTRHALPIAGLPSSLVGRSLAQLSDIHVGSRVSDAYIARTFGHIPALAPDLVVYTGDFTSYHENVYAHAERMYRDAPRGLRTS